MRVSKMLGLGFALSIAGIGGLGSLAALAIGLLAGRAIRESGGEISGMRMAWWCIVVGAFGTLMVPYVAWLVIKASSK
ncbi:MAG TPA: hypothetical protein VKB12_10130 [Pyrinomonadaceae bacterium]|nr:hypothetical protein [Pyrinomonadaceae bacterium]